MIEVRHLMSPIGAFASVHQEATIRDAIMILSREGRNRRTRTGRGGPHDETLVVLDQDNRVAGKLDHADIVTSLNPGSHIRRAPEVIAHTSTAGLSPALLESLTRQYSTWSVPFERRCQEVLKLKVRDCASSPESQEYVRANAPVESALHKLFRGQGKTLLVKGDDGIVGLIGLANVFERLAAGISTWGSSDL